MLGIHFSAVLIITGFIRPVQVNIQIRIAQFGIGKSVDVHIRKSTHEVTFILDYTQLGNFFGNLNQLLFIERWDRNCSKVNSVSSNFLYTELEISTVNIRQSI